MKIATMLGDVVGSFFQQPATQKYPFERQPTPERLRIQLGWDPKECTGCGMCAKDCPSEALEMIVIDKKAKRFVLRYHLDRCTFCAQCVHSCMHNCLTMSNQTWELAALTRESFTREYGEPGDVEYILASQAEPTA